MVGFQFFLDGGALSFLFFLKLLLLVRPLCFGKPMSAWMLEPAVTLHPVVFRIHTKKLIVYSLCFPIVSLFPLAFVHLFLSVQNEPFGMVVGYTLKAKHYARFFNLEKKSNSG